MTTRIGDCTPSECVDDHILASLRMLHHTVKTERIYRGVELNKTQFNGLEKAIRKRHNKLLRDSTLDGLELEYE